MKKLLEADRQGVSYLDYIIRAGYGLHSGVAGELSKLPP
jgi:hypothetical protein